MNSNQNLFINIDKDTQISQIINGMWQVSGAHGSINKEDAIKSMKKHVDNGLITWDLADHYGPAEDYVKIFREKLKDQREIELLEKLQFFTKWVPRPQKITREIVEDAVDISRERMGMDSLDMLQFHWWDYNDKNYLKAIEYLDDLREEGIIKYLGLTNFDTKHLQEFIDMGIKIISNQVQYSLIDRRSESLMQELCEQENIKLFVYGTLGGGLITDRFLNKSEPFTSKLNTASLHKYKNMINIWGGWSLFQEYLSIIKKIADKHDVSIANVAVRYVLENPVVAGAILGVRLGISEHIEENLRVFNFSLDQEDYDSLNRVGSKSRNLLKIIGDCGDEYR